MPIHLVFRLIVSCACTIFLLTGCGYRLAGSSDTRLRPGQELWVAFILNETISSTAQTVIRRAIQDEGHAMRGLIPAAAEGRADFIVSGSLRSYGSRAISYTATDLIREYRLDIDVELELRPKGSNAPLWKGTLHAFQDYPVNNDIALQRNAEEAALAAASRIIAQKFLTAVDQTY